jgi:hypothetical protein
MAQKETKTEVDASGSELAAVESDINDGEENRIESPEHLTGINLVIVVSIVTTVAFLVFLDSSILVTVSYISINSSTANT